MRTITHGLWIVSHACLLVTLVLGSNQPTDQASLLSSLLVAANQDGSMQGHSPQQQRQSHQQHRQKQELENTPPTNMNALQSHLSQSERRQQQQQQSKSGHNAASEGTLSNLIVQVGSNKQQPVADIASHGKDSPYDQGLTGGQALVRRVCTTIPGCQFCGANGDMCSACWYTFGVARFVKNGHGRCSKHGHWQQASRSL